MLRRNGHAAAPIALAVLALAAGCASRPLELVDVTTTRAPAPVVTLPLSGRCPADTVLLGDPDPGSGAGALPVGFEGRVVLRCEVDYSTLTTRAGRDYFTVRQWQGTLTAELQAALALPDREYPKTRGSNVACGSSAGSATDLYAVDPDRRAVRVLPPTDGPCHDLRPEVVALLPDVHTSPELTFTASRPSS